MLTPPGSAARARRTASSPRSSTSSGRPTSSARPGPPPSTRPGTHCSIWRPIVADTIPALTDDLAAALAEHGVALSPEATPLLLGSWIGGDRDGNPNVTAAITHEVLLLQHLTAIKIAINKVDDLLMALSSSTAIVGVSAELPHRSRSI